MSKSKETTKTYNDGHDINNHHRPNQEQNTKNNAPLYNNLSLTEQPGLH